MKTLPLFLRTTDRRIVIVGSGERAVRKCRLALKTDAAITVAAPELDAELEHLVAAGRIRHHPTALTPAVFEGAAVAFIATGSRDGDARAQRLAKAAGVLVNVPDTPELCDALMPAIVDRSPVTVAVGTEGTAPCLARQIKSQVEALLEPRLGDLAAIAGRLRRAASRVSPEKRRSLWEWVFSGEPRDALRRGDPHEAARLIKQAITRGGAPGERAGQVSLVGAGPGSADLITLRGARRLQEADIIFHDRLVAPEVLELARRDAELVYVGKTPGTMSWPQDRINRVIIAAARRGHRVVRLKCGDPGIFGHVAEEVAALRAAGIAWEIVPGVTAAVSAAAAASEFLTERGTTNAVVFTTGQTRQGDLCPDWGRHLVPGTTMALYMAVRASPAVQANLIASGCDPAMDVTIVANASLPSERVINTTLEDMAEKARGADGPTIILLRVPADAERPARAGNGHCTGAPVRARNGRRPVWEEPRGELRPA